MEPALSAGSGYFVPSGPQGDHLFFCVLGPVVINGVESLLSVPVCSVRGNRFDDHTCLIEQGEHSFLKHQSFVSYAQARVDEVAVVERHLASKYFRSAESASSDLQQKILEGLKVSTRVPRYIKDAWLK